MKTVSWVASDPSVPHDTFAYQNITLKGTSSIQGAQVRATWDFGDGSAPVTSTVENRYDVSARRVYTGAIGTVFTATLTIEDTSTGESGSAAYLVALREKSLAVEVNVAIDEGLWYLHKNMMRTAGVCADCISGARAFQQSGHLESGDSADPYTETVARAVAGQTNVQIPSANRAAAQAGPDGPAATLLQLARNGVGPSDPRWIDLETAIIIADLEWGLRLHCVGTVSLRR